MHPKGTSQPACCSSYTYPMLPEEVKELLSGLESGVLSNEDVLARLQMAPTEDLGFAQLDTHRELRQGLPEAIYAEGKTSEQVVAIAERLLATTSSPVLATRCPPVTLAALKTRWPDATISEVARLACLRTVDDAEKTLGLVTVVCAGTSDIPVAEEAGGVCKALGASVHSINDVGVAGVHRLLAVQDEFAASDVVIVVAGMEGALASLVGGLVAAPVIAVPTSVGYGASFGGLAALLAMLNSCAAGITVTNIDNGFGAAIAALKILRKLRT